MLVTSRGSNITNCADLGGKSVFFWAGKLRALGSYIRGSGETSFKEWKCLRSMGDETYW